MAFVVVGSEDKENWSWFLKELRSILNPSRRITFISDRHPGIIDGMNEVFPNEFHGYCLFHLKYNLMDKLKGVHSKFRSRLVYMFTECAYAPNVEIYHEKLEALTCEGGQKVKDFVKDIPVQHWCNAFFEGQRYGEMASSLAESWNKTIDEARYMPITSMIDSIRIKTMKDMADMRRQSQNWNDSLCPKMQTRLQVAFDEGRTWRISSASETLYEVHCEPSMSVST